MRELRGVHEPTERPDKTIIIIMKNNRQGRKMREMRGVHEPTERPDPESQARERRQTRGAGAVTAGVVASEGRRLLLGRLGCPIHGY